MLTDLVVAQLSIRVVVLAGVTDWTAFLNEDQRALSAAVNLQAMVERDSDGFTANL